MGVVGEAISLADVVISLGVVVGPGEAEEGSVEEMTMGPMTGLGGVGVGVDPGLMIEEEMVLWQVGVVEEEATALALKRYARGVIVGAEAGVVVEAGAEAVAEAAAGAGAVVLAEATTEIAVAKAVVLTGAETEAVA